MNCFININFLVKVAPLIEEFLLPSTIQVGQRLSLSCTVIKGDPPFSIQWLKDEEVINDNQKSISVHHLADYSSTLLFKAINSEHRGNYTCIASNAVGQDVRTQEMIPYGKIVFPFFFFLLIYINSFKLKLFLQRILIL